MSQRFGFFLLFTTIVLVIAAHNFMRYYIYKDYPLHVFTGCDPTQFHCFTADPNDSDPTFQAGTYEKVLITASVAPACLDEHTCTNFSCDGIESSCEITYCSADTLEEGESCTDTSVP